MSASVIPEMQRERTPGIDSTTVATVYDDWSSSMQAVTGVRLQSESTD